VDRRHRVAVQVRVAVAGDPGGQVGHRARDLPDLRGHAHGVAPGDGHGVGAGGVVAREAHRGQVRPVRRGVGVGEQGGAGAQGVGLGGGGTVAEPRRHPGERGGQRGGECGSPTAARGGGAGGHRVEQLTHGEIEQRLLVRHGSPSLSR
jgi:hypothetical protein